VEDGGQPREDVIMGGRRGQSGKVRLRVLARLRADGLTCAEIGRRLGLSVRQVYYPGFPR
jgi:hypothetical protein